MSSRIDINMPDIDSILHNSLSRALQHDAIDLIEACATAESTIRIAVRAEIISQLGVYAAQQGFQLRSEDLADFFYCDQTRYRLQTEADLIHPNVLRIVIAGADRKAVPMERHLTSLGIYGLGRSNRVSVKTPRQFASLQSTIADSVRQICESGYRWLSEYVDAALHTLQQDSARELYSEVRRSFDPKLTENIWLFVASGAKGFYILDPIVRQIALTHTRTASISVDLSPIEKLAVFATTQLDFEHDDLYSRKAIVENRTLDVDFSPPTYTRVLRRGAGSIRAPAFYL